MPEGQAKIGACTDTPTPVARRRELHRSAPKRSFLLDRARPVFFSDKTEKKMGGASPLDQPPAGAEIPRGRRTAAHPMLPPHVAPPQQIICGHVEVIRQGHQFLIVRAASRRSHSIW